MIDYENNEEQLDLFKGDKKKEVRKNINDFNHFIYSKQVHHSRVFTDYVIGDKVIFTSRVQYTEEGLYYVHCKELNTVIELETFTSESELVDALERYYNEWQNITVADMQKEN